jgi:SET domain-containing protein
MSLEKYVIDSSPIHGKGIIAKQTIQKGEVIDIGIDYYYGIFPYVTPHFGSWLNHCQKANAHLVYMSHKYYVVASSQIRKGQEITVNYNQTPWYINGSKPHYKPC